MFLPTDISTKCTSQGDDSQVCLMASRVPNTSPHTMREAQKRNFGSRNTPKKDIGFFPF